MRFYFNDYFETVYGSLLNSNADDEDEPLFCKELIQWVKETNTSIYFFTKTESAVKDDVDFIPQEVKIPVATALNAHFNDTDTNSDSLLIEDEDIAILFRLTWL